MNESLDKNSAEIAFEFAPVGLMITENRIIRICNRAFCQMFGYKRDELIGYSVHKLYASDDEFERMGALGITRLQERPTSEDMRIMKRKNGELFWVHGLAHSLTPEDPFARTIWSFQDISETRPIIALTKRERQVAMLVTEGKSAKEIARVLDLSPRTVEAHRTRLMNKYAAKSTAELIAKLASTPV